MLKPKILAILNEARRLLTGPGMWMQGASRIVCGDTTYSRCLLGAIKDAADFLKIEEHEWRMACCVLLDELRVESLATWNDQAQRTQDDVLALLDHVTARLSC